MGAKRKRESVPFDLSSVQVRGASKRARDANAKGKGRASAKGALGLDVDAKALGENARVGGAGRQRGGDVFKVPSVPVRRTMLEADVFGGTASSGKGKEKGKGGEKDEDKDKEKEAEAEGVERENKNVRLLSLVPRVSKWVLIDANAVYVDREARGDQGTCA